jgi:hypothetical protein
LNEIMDVYIAKANAPESEACATLTLPAMPFEFFDALDKARVQQGDELYFEVSEYHDFEFMEPYISDADNLVELNALCQKLSELDERQSAVFEGLLKMEVSKKAGSISLGKLIDLAYSADCCHVVDTALNDSQLGRFYAENGFVPEIDNLSDRLFDLLDFERIGRELRQGEGGVFTEHGYVVQHSGLNEVYENMDFHIRTPEYQILLELADGSRVGLPCAELPDTAHHACVDCRIPQLIAAIDVADIQSVNDFAEMLQGMGDKPVRKYKAILHAVGCNALEEAVKIAAHTDEFTFEENISSFRELAMDELKFTMRDEDAELLAQHTNMHSYGMALQKRDNSVISQYGLVERGDNQPIQTPLEGQKQHGMEMM